MATSFIFVAKVRTPFKKTFPANLFLYLFVLYIEVYREVFSCPLTGFLHFYNPYILERGTVLNVSMPFNGLSSFLRYNTYQSRQKRHMYQCPLTGFLYFYKTNFFSENDDALVYQCPLTGFLYFYTFRDLNTIMN